jgi:hypothetical protein
MYKVKIISLPNKKGLNKAEFGRQVDGALALRPTSYGGADWRESKGASYDGVKKSISKVPRDKANLEAEDGEYAFGNITGQSIPDNLKIVGKRHTEGGVPLNLPDDTFIFSDTASMKITDPAVLAMFNKNPKKGGYTPAELAKPYDIQKYKSILLDPESGKLERKTAELMIKNMIMKLGALALAQEAKKGFPQGIPEVAKPYMEAHGIKEEDLMPELKEQAEAMAKQQQGMSQGNPEMQAKEQAEMPDQTMDQNQAMANQGQQQFPEQMPSGAPIATPENTGGMEGQPMMQPGMRYGGLRRAAEGMQQPSPEEMAMMEQQRQPQPQQGGNDQMKQIMQQVAQALQQGIEPQKVTAKLLQGKIPPQAIAQIFVQLGMPEVEVQQLITSVIQELQGGQQQMEEAPMAAYGMQMGGYDMPFAEYAYGGYYEDGGYLPKAGGGKEVPKKPLVKKKVDKKIYNESKWEIKNDDQGEYKYNKTYGDVKGKGHVQTKEERDRQGKGGGGGNYTKEDVCRWVSDPNNKDYYGWSGDDAFNAGLIDKSNITFIDNCSGKLEKEVIDEQAIYAEEPNQECWCTVDGKEVPGKTNPDWDGVDLATKCLPCTESVKSKKCKCVDPNTGEEKIFEIENEEQCVCEEGWENHDQGYNVPQQSPHWSKNAQINLATNALMRTGVAPQNVVVPPRAQTKGAYEEYQTKVDTALAAEEGMKNAIMYGMSGSTGAKQAAMKDMLGQGLRSSMNAVADVQSRNVDRQRATNSEIAQIDNSNMLTRNAVQNQSLANQAANQNQRTANLNKRDFNTARATMDANEQMKNLHDIQMTTPQFGAEYDYGMVYHTGVPKTPNPLGGGETYQQKVDRHMRNGSDYDKAADRALREMAMEQKNSGVSFGKKGGYIFGIYPGPFTM